MKLVCDGRVGVIEEKAEVKHEAFRIARILRGRRLRAASFTEE